MDNIVLINYSNTQLRTKSFIRILYVTESLELDVSQIKPDLLKKEINYSTFVHVLKKEKKASNKI